MKEFLTFETSVPRRKRLEWLDRSAGLAIFLVVLGHMGNINPPGMNYLLLKHLIYAFHMPLFMALSGFAMFHSWISPRRPWDYASYIFKKFRRLFPGYLFIAGLIVVVKISVQQHFRVDNPLKELDEIWLILLKPAQSPVGFLWYIYVLMEYYIIFPLLLLVFRQALALLLIPALCLYFFSDNITSIFQADLFCRYQYFFLLGVLFAQWQRHFMLLLAKCGQLFFVLFFAGMYLLVMFNLTKDINAKLILGTLSIPAVAWMVQVRPLCNANFLSTWGQNMFPIYLMNTLVIGGLRAILHRFFSDSGAVFIITAPLILLAGVYLPITVSILLHVVWNRSEIWRNKLVSYAHLDCS